MGAHRSGKVRDRAVWDTKRCRCARAEFGSLFSFLAEKKKLGLACGQFPPRDLCLKGPTEKTSGGCGKWAFPARFCLIHFLHTTFSTAISKKQHFFQWPAKRDMVYEQFLCHPFFVWCNILHNTCGENVTIL